MEGQKYFYRENKSQGLGALLMIYICDTCVLIDYLRGKNEVRQKLQQDKEQGLGMASVTYMEICKC